MQLACLQFIMSLKIKSLMMTLELKQVDIKSTVNALHFRLFTNGLTMFVTITRSTKLNSSYALPFQNFKRGVTESSASASARPSSPQLILRFQNGGK